MHGSRFTVRGVGAWGSGVGGWFKRQIGSDSCITQLKAQGPCRTCNESKEEEEEAQTCVGHGLVADLVEESEVEEGRHMLRVDRERVPAKCEKLLHRNMKRFR